MKKIRKIKVRKWLPSHLTVEKVVESIKKYNRRKAKEIGEE